jgi:hypothetical protein
MSPPREDPRDWAARGSHKNGLHHDDLGESYSQVGLQPAIGAFGTLAEWRARREARRSIALAAQAVSDWVAGEAPLDEVLDLIQSAGSLALRAQLSAAWPWLEERESFPGPRSA